MSEQKMQILDQMKATAKEGFDFLIQGEFFKFSHLSQVIEKIKNIFQSNNSEINMQNQENKAVSRLLVGSFGAALWVNLIQFLLGSLMVESFFGHHMGSMGITRLASVSALIGVLIGGAISFGVYLLLISLMRYFLSTRPTLNMMLVKVILGILLFLVATEALSLLRYLNFFSMGSMLRRSFGAISMINLLVSIFLWVISLRRIDILLGMNLEDDQTIK